MADINIKKKSQAELLAELKQAYKEGRYSKISSNIKSLHNAPKYLVEASKQYRREQRGAHRKRTGAVKESKYTETISPKVTKPKTTKPKAQKPTPPRTPKSAPTKPYGVSKTPTPTPQAPSLDDLYNIPEFNSVKDAKTLKSLSDEQIKLQQEIKRLQQNNPGSHLIDELEDRKRNIESSMLLILSAQETDLVSKAELLSRIAEYKGIELQFSAFFESEEFTAIGNLSHHLTNMLDDEINQTWRSEKAISVFTEVKKTIQTIEDIYNKSKNQEIRNKLYNIMYNISEIIVSLTSLTQHIESNDVQALADYVEPLLFEAQMLDDIKKQPDEYLYDSNQSSGTLTIYWGGYYEDS